MYNQFIPYRDRLLCFNDTETLGRNFQKHAIIQYAYIHESRDQKQQYDLKNLYIMPTLDDLKIAEEKAIEVNNFSMEKWEEYGAKPLSYHVDEIIASLKDRSIIPVGFNWKFFDYRVLRYNIYRINPSASKEISEFAIDLMDMCIALFTTEGLNRVNQESVFKYLSKDKINKLKYKGKSYILDWHGAHVDILGTRYIYWKILELFKGQRMLF